MRVTIIGTGYVGLTTGVSLAYLGHQVTAVDKDPRKIALLEVGVPPIHEMGLEALLAAARPRLAFTGDTVEAVPGAEVVIIAVGTPPKNNGEADTGYVEAAAREVALGLCPGQACTVVVKSTVPLGTNRRVAGVINRALKERGVEADVSFASNPEFLQEGQALRDAFYPDRIIVGAESDQALEVMSRLYRPLLEQSFTPPIEVPRPERYNLPHMITTDPTSAEMIKYAANAFLAVKVSYINEIAGLCDRVGADVADVARGIGSDPRIGHRFLGAGLGWGGSCFPKDTSALLSMSTQYAYTLPIVQAARDVNQRQRLYLVDRVQSVLKVLRGRTVAVLGLAFKPNTDDTRESPALDVIRILLERGAHVRAQDPVALENARTAMGALADEVELVEDPYEAVLGAEAVIIATAWDRYRELDLPRLADGMKTPIMVDGVNLYQADAARAAGFQYTGVGRA